MNVADVSAEILYGVITRFTPVSVGVVNIPKNREIVACEAVEHITEPCGVGVDATGLYKYCNVKLYSGR